MEPESRESHLEKAALLGNTDEVVELISGNDFDPQSDEAHQALQHAVERNRWEVVRVLIVQGGMDMSQDSIGGLILQHATVCGNLDMVTFAVTSGLQVHSAAASTAVQGAAALGHVEILQYLFQSGATLTSEFEAVCDAARAGFWDVVMYLMTKGLDLTTNGIGVQLLALAVVNGQCEIVSYLEGQGVRINSKQTKVALKHLSSAKWWDKYRNAVEYLLDSDADFDADAAEAVLLTAAKYGDACIVRQLLKSKVDISSSVETCALAHAGLLGSAEGEREVISLLRERGVEAPPMPQLITDADF